MPEGEKRHLGVERIIRLFEEGRISIEVAEKLLKEIRDGGDEHCEPETKWGAAGYVRVSASCQEAACVELAESLGYQVDDAYVYGDDGSGGGADA